MTKNTTIRVDIDTRKLLDELKFEREEVGQTVKRLCARASKHKLVLANLKIAYELEGKEVIAKTSKNEFKGILERIYKDSGFILVRNTVGSHALDLGLINTIKKIKS